MKDSLIRLLLFTVFLIIATHGIITPLIRNNTIEVVQPIVLSDSVEVSDSLTVEPVIETTIEDTLKVGEDENVHTAR